MDIAELVEPEGLAVVDAERAVLPKTELVEQ